MPSKPPDPMVLGYSAAIGIHLTLDAPTTFGYTFHLVSGLMNNFWDAYFSHISKTKPSLVNVPWKQMTMHPGELGKHQGPEQTSLQQMRYTPLKCINQTAKTHSLQLTSYLSERNQQQWSSERPFSWAGQILLVHKKYLLLLYITEVFIVYCKSKAKS